MTKKVLSLALVLVMCMGLAVPALAAGEKKVVTVEEFGITVTMDGFLREETHRYMVDARPEEMTIYVVADNSTVTLAAMEGYRYATEAELENYPWPTDVARNGETVAEKWSDNRFLRLGGGAAFPLTGPSTNTVEPSDRIMLSGPINILCESDFAKLTPFEEKINAADWAQGDLEKAYDARLFPNSINPYEEDCARSMTRAEFAAVAVKLYSAISGNPAGEGYEHPFTDVDWYTNTDYNIGYAYNLGFVNGTSDTTFTPDGTLTREQAAVMLSRVYAKLHGDIPAVTATTFADDASIGSWAKSGVAFMADKGIMSGVGGNKFAPQQVLSVQEAMVMAKRMLENLK